MRPNQLRCFRMFTGMGGWFFLIAGGGVVMTVVMGCLLLEWLTMECLCPMCSDICDE